MNRHMVNIQKVCWYCKRRSARYQRKHVPSLLRILRETGGTRVDTYAHPACLERTHGRAWMLLCADPLELKLFLAARREAHETAKAIEDTMQKEGVEV